MKRELKPIKQILGQLLKPPPQSDPLCIVGSGSVGVCADQSARCRGGLSQGADNAEDALRNTILRQSLSRSLFFNLGYWNSMGPPQSMRVKI